MRNEEMCRERSAGRLRPSCGSGLGPAPGPRGEPAPPAARTTHSLRPLRGLPRRGCRGTRGPLPPLELPPGPLPPAPPGCRARSRPCFSPPRLAAPSSQRQCRPRGRGGKALRSCRNVASGSTVVPWAPAQDPGAPGRGAEAQPDLPSPCTAMARLRARSRPLQLCAALGEGQWDCPGTARAPQVFLRF